MFGVLPLGIHPVGGSQNSVLWGGFRLPPGKADPGPKDPPNPHLQMSV